MNTLECEIVLLTQTVVIKENNPLHADEYKDLPLEYCKSTSSAKPYPSPCSRSRCSHSCSQILC